MTTKPLVIGSLSMIMLIFGVLTNTTGSAFATPEKQEQHAMKIDLSKLTQAVKSTFKHVTASKPHKSSSEKYPNTSGTVSYGNYSKSTFSKSSNHQVTLEKRPGHMQ